MTKKLKLLAVSLVVFLIGSNAFAQEKTSVDDFAKGSSAGSLEGYFHFSKAYNVYGFMGRYGKYFADNVYWTIGLGYSKLHTSTPYTKPVLASNGHVYDIPSHIYTDANYLHVPANIGYVFGKLTGLSFRIEGGLMLNYIMSMKVGESGHQESTSDYDHFGIVPTIRAAVGVYSFHVYAQYNIAKSSKLMYGFAFQW